jgi:hypothetical protein
MKRIISASFAIALAIAATAFTLPKHTDTMYVFEYDGDGVGDYTLDHVENPSNTYWKFVGEDESLCAGPDIKACRIAVTGSFVDNTTSPTELSGITIEAEESSNDVAFVKSISGSGNQISNKP